MWQYQNGGRIPVQSASFYLGKYASNIGLSKAIGTKMEVRFRGFGRRRIGRGGLQGTRRGWEPFLTADLFAGRPHRVERLGRSVELFDNVSHAEFERANASGVMPLQSVGDMFSKCARRVSSAVPPKL